MQARTTTPQLNGLTSWIVAVLGIALLVILLLSFIVESGSPTRGEVVGTSSARVAYLQFGVNADTLWVTSTEDPGERERMLVLPHATGYGVVPSVSPAGDRFVYTALPPEVRAPGHDTPAGLWLAGVSSGLDPLLLASNVDLLVQPIWSPDGNRVVYRRSTNEHVLAMKPVDGGEEIVIAYSETASLFPVGFTPAADVFYYVALSESEGSRLRSIQMNSGVKRDVALLSESITREWSLSPDAAQLAYLTIDFNDPAAVTSQAFVLELATGKHKAVTEPGVAAFGPTWDGNGNLALGRLDGDEASLLQLINGAPFSEPGPEQGFEVPLSFSPAGGYLARAFEHESVSAPGGSALTFVDAAGERHIIASGEVTFVGWTR